ncbi:MAG: hypothetical protein Q9226_006012 [Calogaya cf. arnoldii]
MIWNSALLGTAVASIDSHGSATPGGPHRPHNKLTNPTSLPSTTLLLPYNELMRQFETMSTTQVDAHSSAGSLSPFPVELLTAIFCHLPSSSDVLSLASTCHHLQTIWQHNVVTIYPHTIKPTITCSHHARHLLFAQGGPTPESEITSAKDIIRMLRTQHAIDKAILGFEREIVRHVKTRGYRAEDYYGPDGVNGHPPHLTRTERLRFIRSYYTLWELLSIDDPIQRQSKLQTMSLKQLLYLCEISWLPDGLGPGEGVASTPEDLDSAPGSNSMIDQRQRIEEREKLSAMILASTKQMYQRIHGCEMELIWVIAMDEGFGDFLVMWDHWRSSLQEVICGRRSKEPPYKKEFLWELWEHSDDGEGA